MYIKKNILVIIASAVFLSVYIIPVSAYEQGIIFSTGLNCIVSRGLTESYLYYKPHVSAGYKWNPVKISAGYERYIRYQISDSSGMHDYIGVNNINGEIGLNPAEGIDINFKGEFIFGESDYSSMYFSPGIEFEYGNSLFTVEGAFSKTSYNLNLEKTENRSYDFYIEGAYYFSNDLSSDLSYTYQYNDTVSQDYIYQSHTLRAGMVAGLFDNFFAVGGIKAGLDTSDYLKLGADAGFNIYLFDHLKFSAMGVFEQNIELTSSSKKQTSPPSLITTEGNYSTLKIIFGISYSKW